VHTAYVAEILLGQDEGSSRVYQIVCSPFRNPLTPLQRRVVRLTGSRAAAGLFARLARASGVAPSTPRWRFVRGPTFDNSIGELELDGRAARATIRRAAATPGEPRPSLETLHHCTLSQDGTG
jgi:hypothetical protein